MALVTTTAYIPKPAEDDWYNVQIHEEDRLLAEGLKANGLTSSRIDWNDSRFDWSAIKVAVIRTTWDYSYRYPEFSAWLDRVASQTTLMNPAGLMRWNMDKHYLGDLAKKNIPVVDTFFVEEGEGCDLQDLARERGWQEIVIKPAVSGGARNTFRAAGSAIGDLQRTFDACISEESMLIQPFQKEILETGEVSLMLMGGEYTHAVRKIARAGDFRVQDDHGGTVHEYDPPKHVVNAAERAVAACPQAPVYARVDLVLASDGPRLMELELVEPELWMRFSPPSARKLANAIARQAFTPVTSGE